MPSSPEQAYEYLPTSVSKAEILSHEFPKKVRVGEVSLVNEQTYYKESEPFEPSKEAQKYNHPSFEYTKANADSKHYKASASVPRTSNSFAPQNNNYIWNNAVGINQMGSQGRGY